MATVAKVFRRMHKPVASESLVAGGETTRSGRHCGSVFSSSTGDTAGLASSCKGTFSSSATLVRGESGSRARENKHISGLAKDKISTSLSHQQLGLGGAARTVGHSSQWFTGRSTCQSG